MALTVITEDCRYDFPDASSWTVSTDTGQLDVKGDAGILGSFACTRWFGVFRTAAVPAEAQDALRGVMSGEGVLAPGTAPDDFIA